MKKNIMFIIPTLCGGGAEKTVANLSNYLIDKYNIYIVVFKDTETKYSYSGNLIILNNNPSKNVFKKIIFTIKSIFKLKKLKKDLKIDYSISFLTPADSLNVFSKVKTCKNYISIRNTDSILMKNKIMRLLTKVSCKKCDHIISISKQVQDDIINNFGIKKGKITTIYNPSLSIEFGKSDNIFEESFYKKNKVIVNIGRLTEQKGQWHLIKAFSKVVEKVPNAKLLILGQGEMKERLEKLVKMYKMERHVFLVGFVNNPYDYLKKSKCFIFSSLFEGLGNSLLEAMSCEVPIISTDCISGPREILAPNTDYRKKVENKYVKEEYGILTPVFKSSDDNVISKEELILSNAICEMITSEKLLCHYKEKSRERVKDFKIENIVMQWIETIER